jgi:hypothetical protein
MSQLTEGKCLRCASFLSRPQNTWGTQDTAGGRKWWVWVVGG